MMQQNINSFDLDSASDWLKSQGYKILRPLVPQTSYCDTSPAVKLLKAAILDTETTGKNTSTDKIIELGILIVEYCPDTGQLYRVLETYDELEDPGMLIPPESTKIHGITDDMVSGKRIIDSDVEKLLSDVGIIIAHNAAFDRALFEARFPSLHKKAWACSYKQIPWKDEGFEIARLEFLAYKFGFHFDAHRASDDCFALLEVLQSELPIAGVSVFKMLLNNARAPDFKLWALNTPYETKDKLKGRGYYWDSERRTWYITVSNADLAAEAAWLQTEVYANHTFKLEQEKMNAYNRFSIRSGEAEVVNY
jgi:DNA polymerase-3 subunit epsilon